MANSPFSTSSRASSPNQSPSVVPVKRSVQALLDELSDSDSDVIAKRKHSAPKSTETQQSINESTESSDDNVFLGGGRLAARLAGGISHNSTTADSRKPQTNTKTDLESNGTARSGRTTTDEQEEEEVEISKPHRRMLLKRKRTSDNDGGSPHRNHYTPIRSSPTPTQPVSPSIHENEGPSKEKENQPITGKSKFTILVEKARKERLAREEAENAKKAARQAQMQTAMSPKRRGPRGSSPADDSEEDSDQSDAAPAKRLTNNARPTRKASKKALEEMNRETQRMNRSMQLAHQAKTRKKFTKESFFASFGQTLPLVPEAVEASTETTPTSLSSQPSSDADNTKLDSAPPTSPLPEPELEKIAPAVNVDLSRAPNAAEDDFDDELDLMEIIASRKVEQVKPAITTQRQLRSLENAPLVSTKMASIGTAQEHHGSDSDSDIEVVFAKGSKRKYAAFENLPKRKARETSSHLALRSLAHIKNEKDKKSTISTADMGPSLLRAARRQAQEERQAKIEKLKAAGVTIQTAEEREQDQEELEDLVERARLEDEEIRQREKELAKKDGTYTKDALDDEDSDEEDGDFEDCNEDSEGISGSEEENDGSEGDDEGAGTDDEEETANELVDAAAEESAEEADSGEDTARSVDQETAPRPIAETPMPTRTTRRARVIVDDEDDEGNFLVTVESPALPSARKTPQSIIRSARKIIPGLQHSDDLPLGLTQAFAATMADSQTQQESATQEQDSMDILRDLPSPQIGIMPRLDRLESLDLISESVAGSQTQPLDLYLGMSQSQRVPESPAMLNQQALFELTQDAGYSFSPFTGNRFAETPSKGPHSTEETVILPAASESPVAQRRGRLQRGQQANDEDDSDTAASKSAFHVMNKAAKRKLAEDFNKKKSEARQAFEEAAEESDDEYAGLGGASDDDSGEENEDDRRMIDEDTQVGKGDEAKLAKLYADRERQSDEQAVSKLLKDITTGALRRKRGAGDELDLSDEEDAVARRREAKRREFAKMRRELLKDEAVGKIAEDKRKQAFLKSIEDHEDDNDDDDDFDQPETLLDVDSQSHSQQTPPDDTMESQPSRSTALKPASDSHLNALPYNVRRAKAAASRRPGTLAEIRESVSFLIEEPDSQAGIIDLGLSDSEEEPEAYVNLDRHVAQAEADENAMDGENDDLGGFVVDDEDQSTNTADTTFKKPELPTHRVDRAPFTERRTNAADFVDRLSLLRQKSSSSVGSNASSKMAFLTGKSAGGLNKVPSLLKRATTASSLGSISGRESVSATGVVTNKTERGGAAREKEFVRKGANTSRNAINYQARQNLKEEKMSARAGVAKKQQKKKGGGFLTGLFRGDKWG